MPGSRLSSLFAWCALSALSSAHAATVSELLNTASLQLQQHDEQHALETLEGVRRLAAGSPDDLALVHLYLGLAHAGLANKPSSLESFKSALVLQPALELPSWVSPTAAQWWLEAGGRPLLIPAERSKDPPSPPAPAPEQHWRTTHTVSVGLGLGALVATGIGLFFGQRASTLATTAQRDQELGSALNIRGQAETSAVIANVLFASAGTLGLACVVFLVLP